MGKDRRNPGGNARSSGNGQKALPTVICAQRAHGRQTYGHDGLRFYELSASKG